MYPRNAASPERIAVGAVVQISDGVVQGSGVTITVRGQGGAEGSGAGTTAYGASGIVYYLPTQGETDFTSFVVIASKTGCIPVSITLITSASATPGYAGVDWGFVANKTTTNALTATTIATTQKVDVETIKTQAVTAAAGVTFPTSIASPTNITAGTITTATNLTTNNDKTGYGLSAGAVQAIWDALTSALTAAGSIGKKLADWVIGTSQTGDSFARIGAAGAGLTALGDTRIANLDATVSSRLATSGYTVPPTVGAIADQVWDEAIAGHAGAGSTGLALSSASAPTAAAVADAVWDEALSGHVGAGSAGEALDAAGTAGDPWVTPLPGAYGAGTAGKIVGDNINATISSRATQTSVDTVDGIADSILVDTAEIGVAGAGLTVLASAANLANVLADTNEIQTDWANGGRLDVILDARASQTTADAILTDTAEIGAAGAGLTAIASQASVTAVDDLLDTEIPALTVAVAAVKTQTDKLTFTVANKVDSNTLAINGDADAAATSAILNGSNVVYRGTVTGAATTSTLIDSGLTDADIDWYKARIIIFTSVIPRQGTAILAFDPTTDKLTFEPTTQAPTGATFVII